MDGTDLCGYFLCPNQGKHTTAEHDANTVDEGMELAIHEPHEQGGYYDGSY